VVPIRFRLRTIMIAIASSAILMCVIRIAGPVLRVKGIWVHREGLNVVVESFDRAPGSKFNPPPGTPTDDFCVAIPLLRLFILTALPITLWSFHVIAGLTEKIDARNQASRSMANPEPDQSGEPEGA
jgi:hypothetical protein